MSTDPEHPNKPPAGAHRGRAHRPKSFPDANAENRLPVRLLKFAGTAIARLYHRTYVRAPLRLPRRGAGILVCNHISGLDPLMIQSVSHRTIVWMMAREYYDIPKLRWVFKAIEAIPVDRSGRDMAATRAALRALEHGRILGVFPEGRIEDSRELLPFQTGVAMMAMRMDVPVYPGYLDGSQRGMTMLQAFAIPHETTLAFGPAVEFDRSDTSRQGLEQATLQIQQAVARLQPLVCRS